MAQYNELVKRYRDAEEVKDWRNGLLCAVMANCHRDAKKKPSPFKAEDFMPRRHGERKKSTPDEMLNWVRIMNAAHGGKEIIRDG
uniref:Minor tail T domain-containing protein n=1 Tax=viral metagenome TaxID=1070528 RepID=A0A6M3IXI5_9ZZZZ